MKVPKQRVAQAPSINPAAPAGPNDPSYLLMAAAHMQSQGTLLSPTAPNAPAA